MSTELAAIPSLPCDLLVAAGEQEDFRPYCASRHPKAGGLFRCPRTFASVRRVAANGSRFPPLDSVREAGARRR